MKTLAAMLMALTMLTQTALAQTPPSTSPQPPLAPRQNHVMQWHGESVNDPWHWLREKDTPPVLNYLKAENAHTAAMTAGLQPFTDALYQEMLGRIQQTDLDVPVRRGAWYYYSRTVEGQQYPIRARRAARADGSDPGTGVSSNATGATGAMDASSPEQVLLDLNAMAAGKAFISLGDTVVSDDGRSLAYTIDDTGFRQYSLYRKDLTTGAVQGPLAQRVTSLEWAADNATLFFTTEHPVSKRSNMLWRLKPGSEPGAQPEALHEEQDELFRVALARTKDRRYLLLRTQSTDTWEVRLLDAQQPLGAFKVLLPREKGHKYAVGHRDGLLYIRTNRDAKDFRIVTAPVAQPAQWTPLLAHQPGVLIDSMDVFADHLVVVDKQAGLSRFRIHDFKQGGWRELPFAETTYAAFAMATPEYRSSSFRYAYQSPVTPQAVYDHDFASGRSTLRKQQAVLGGYDASKYAAERIWVTARDGVRVPVSMVYRKDRPRDGSAPLWLYAYGSYGLGMSASFASWRLSLLDHNMAFAIAHIRGGNEMGESWHDDGMLMKKMNTFTDFIDVADDLVKTKWTAPSGLLIEGGSAGGLLMGVVSNLRPELFRAVHAAVPLVDVINTMMDASLPLTVGEYLEWGNPKEKAAFDYMRAYSPYDNLAAQAYPAMLVTTSYNDSQVMYWEPAKYVAKLRTLKTDSQPLLLKTKLEAAGHGGASGRYDALKDKAFEMAWMLQQVGITK